MPEIRLTRPPQDPDELWWTIKTFWGVSLPRKRVCPDHVAPFEAVEHAYFAREPNYAVWYASRGSSKSLALAVLGLTKTFIADADCTILGGSSMQSQNVRNHMSRMLRYKNAPLYALKRDIATVIETHSDKMIQPLPASQTSVRGPHPPLQLLDEIDEMDWDIYEASMGQAMEQLNTRGELIGEYIVASSTWQNPEGTMTRVIEQAREKGMPVFTWCWRELLQENGGWMSRRFINNKRRTVSDQMWKTEYELNEPSGASRAFDLDKVEEFFVDYPEPIDLKVTRGETEEMWRWENYSPNATYAAGADWAKENDKTVVAVIRTDILPRRVVYLHRINRAPYPEMAKIFSDAVKEYHAVPQHDGTGVGNAVNDFLAEEAQHKFVMVGRPRTEMLVGYIADFEHGGYRLPKAATPTWRAHRATTTADIYAPAKWDAHVPDDVVALALAHRAAGRIPIVGEIQQPGVDNTPREVDKPFHELPPQDDGVVVGDVRIIDERWGEDTYQLLV